MNLSPHWVITLRAGGHDALHWSEVGNPRAKDTEVLERSAADARVLVTHDLDFGAILAASGAARPSVLQLRTQEVTPEAMGPTLLAAIDQFATELAAGALVSVDPLRARVRVLPLREQSS